MQYMVLSLSARVRGGLSVYSLSSLSPSLSLSVSYLKEDTLYTCCIWYCHSLREFVVDCQCKI